MSLFLLPPGTSSAPVLRSCMSPPLLRVAAFTIPRSFSFLQGLYPVPLPVPVTPEIPPLPRGSPFPAAVSLPLVSRVSPGGRSPIVLGFEFSLLQHRVRAGKEAAEPCLFWLHKRGKKGRQGSQCRQTARGERTERYRRSTLFRSLIRVIEGNGYLASFLCFCLFVFFYPNT